MLIPQCTRCGYRIMYFEPPCPICGCERLKMQSEGSDGSLWYVYVLQLSDGSLYAGIAKSLESRMRDHREGTGSKCVRSKRPFKLVWHYSVLGRSPALKIEAWIKKQPRVAKVEFLSKHGVRLEEK